MKIVDVEVIELRVPGWAGGTFDGSYDDCLVVVHTDAGLRHFGSGLKAIKIVDDPFWRDDLDKTAELISAAGPRVSCGFSPGLRDGSACPGPDNVYSHNFVVANTRWLGAARAQSHRRVHAATRPIRRFGSMCGEKRSQECFAKRLHRPLFRSETGGLGRNPKFQRFQMVAKVKILTMY